MVRHIYRHTWQARHAGNDIEWVKHREGGLFKSMVVVVVAVVVVLYEIIDLVYIGSFTCTTRNREENIQASRKRTCGGYVIDHDEFYLGKMMTRSRQKTIF